MVSDISFLRPVVIVPLTLYAPTAVVGATISAPGYLRLLRFAEAQEAGSPPVDHDDRVSRLRVRLVPLGWLNRTELALVLGIGFVLLARGVQ